MSAPIPRAGSQTEPAPPEIRNPIFARLYHYALGKEGGRMVARRRELMSGLAWTIVEVGPGNGPGFRHYPPSVSRVVAVEPEPYLRERASEAAQRAKVSIEVVAGVAEALPVEDGGADAVLCVLVLCSVPDQRAALAEVRRVLRPGGELRVFEHVVARNPVARAAQRAADATFWPRAFGCV